MTRDELIAWGKGAADRWAVVDGCVPDTEPSELEHACVKHRACKPGSSVTFCEDTHFDPSWKKDWNHTVREEYRALTWRWFHVL